MASTDARPLPQKNVAYRVTFPLLDADGDFVTGAAGLDSEISKDGGAFTDCTNEATEIASGSGIYYLDLTSTEMNADTVAVIVKTSTVGAKTTPIVLYPEEAGDVRVNLTQWVGVAPSALISGRVDANAQVVGDKTGYSLSAGGVQAVWDALSAALTTADSIGKRLVDYLTGDVFGRLGAPAGASVSADVAAVKLQTAAIETDTQDIQGRLPAALVSGRMSADAVAISGATAAADAVEANIGNLDAAVSGRSSHAAADVWAVATRALTDKADFTLSAAERLAVADALLARTLAAESYAADGAVPTLSQILYMLWSAVGDFSISGTTLTCKQLDGTTEAMTFTLDSATAPTSRTRAT